MSINFKFVKKDPHDSFSSWNNRPWAGWDPLAEPEEVWEYNRGVWRLGDDARDEKIATFSYGGKIVLVAAITGIEEVGPEFYKNGKRRRALQGYVLHPGHSVHDELHGSQVRKGRREFNYHDTSHLDHLISDPELYTGKIIDHEAEVDSQGRIVNPELRKKIEDAAQIRLENHYRAQGWEVDDVRHDGPFDAIAKKGDEVRYLEAKGTQSKGSTVIVTNGEVNHAREHPGECVIGILSGLRFTDEGEIDDQDATFVVREWNPRDEDLQAIDYRWDSTSTPGI